MSETPISRRTLLNGSAILSVAALTGCVTEGSPPPDQPLPRNEPAPRFDRNADTGSDFNYASIYGPVSDGGFTIPAVPYQQVPERFRRQYVRNTTGEGPGKLVVQTSNHFLFYTLPGGRAIRYGVGLGRAGFEWSGTGNVKVKRRWPKWHPPDEMIEREPELERYRTTFNESTGEYEGGMEPGLTNPLGARALYIWQNGKDTLYRLHGSPEWNSIGKSVSSGCVRLMNQDVIDLYNRVPDGTDIIVR